MTFWCVTSTLPRHYVSAHVPFFRRDALFPMNKIRRRALATLLGTLLVYALLVATHEGEFWPFSIYPMFSQAGQPWSRAVVRDVSDAETVAWDTLSARDALPGTPFPLAAHGIDPIDLANFVSKSARWDAARVNGLRTMFYDHVPERDLLVMRVNGRLVEGDSVAVTFVPYVFVRADTAAVNPLLAASVTP